MTAPSLNALRATTRTCWGCGAQFTQRLGFAQKPTKFHSSECRRQFLALRSATERSIARKILEWERLDPAGDQDKAALALIAIRRECRALNEVDAARRR